MQKFYIRFVEAVSKTILKITFELENPNKFSFQPGQYIKILIPPYGKMQSPAIRSYSIAELHGPLLIIYVAIVEEGLASGYFQNPGIIDTQLWFCGPEGNFLSQPMVRPRIFISNSTGIAPFLAWFQAQPKGKPLPFPVICFYLTTDPSRTFAAHIFKKTIEDLSPIDIYYGPTDGEILEKLAILAGTVPGAYDVFMAGSPVMLAEVDQILRVLGQPDNQIFYDDFA